jgi:hypothetical protein
MTGPKWATERKALSSGEPVLPSLSDDVEILVLARPHDVAAPERRAIADRLLGRGFLFKAGADYHRTYLGKYYLAGILKVMKPTACGRRAANGVSSAPEDQLAGYRTKAGNARIDRQLRFLDHRQSDKSVYRRGRFASPPWVTPAPTAQIG